METMNICVRSPHIQTGTSAQHNNYTHMQLHWSFGNLIR